MSFGEYARFAYAAMKLDAEDPLMFWRDMDARQERVCAFLSSVKGMRYVGLDTNLTFNVEGRN